MGIYILGILFGVISTFILSRVIKHKKQKLVINLPNYKLPNIKEIIKKVFSMIKDFVVKIGVYVVPFSIILTLLFIYPQGEKIENTYGGKVGNYIQVVFEPIGFNREMSIAVISGLIAKEVTVSTLGSLYYIKDGDTDGLINKIKNDESVSMFSGISFMIFVLLYTPCVGAIFAARRELGNKWGMIFFFYPLLFAWIMSFLAYQSLILLF